MSLDPTSPPRSLDAAVVSDEGRGTGPSGGWSFPSILFDRGPWAADARQPTPDPPPEPACFADLNLGGLVESVVRGRLEYRLRELFHQPLDSVESVDYRHAVFRDLDEDSVRRPVEEFVQRIRTVRRHLDLVDARHYTVQKRRTYLEAAHEYVEAVTALRAALGDASLPSSSPLAAVRDALGAYVAAAAFVSLRRDAEEVLTALGEVRYRLRIHGDTVQVGPAHEDDDDYAADVRDTFARFRRKDDHHYLAEGAAGAQMDHVEATIAGLVAQLYPRAFDALDTFADRHAEFLDAGVVRFHREIQFYLAYRELMARLHGKGLEFCLPTVSLERSAVDLVQAFDPALADSLADSLAESMAEDATPVTNDVHLRAGESVLVVTGPNQGGKTTFARMVGQIHYLAALGVPVPAAEAVLGLADDVLCLFEQGENLADLRGHLHDDLVRTRAVLEGSTDRTVLVVNEIFTSTSLQDATYLAGELMREILDRRSLCVFVTFMDELSTTSERTVSFVAEVDPEDSARRTFRVSRRPADGLAYAKAVASRYGLDSAGLRRRLP